MLEYTLINLLDISNQKLTLFCLYFVDSFITTKLCDVLYKITKKRNSM